MGDDPVTIYDTFGCLTVWRRIYDYLVCDPSVHVSDNAVALRMTCRDVCALGNEYDTSHCAPEFVYMVRSDLVWPSTMADTLGACSIPNITAVGVITPRTTQAYRAKQVLAGRYFGLMHSLLKAGYAECAQALGRTSHYMAYVLRQLASAWDAPVQCPDCGVEMMPVSCSVRGGMLFRSTDMHECMWGPTTVIGHTRLISFQLAMRLSQTRRTPAGRLPDPLGGRGHDVKRRRLNFGQRFVGQ